jgi:hypothetical protein
MMLVASEMQTLHTNPAAAMAPAEAPDILFLVNCGAYSLMAAHTPA